MQLYFPYVDLNFDSRDLVIILNLDKVSALDELFDQRKQEYVSENDIISRFTIMYKTKEHQFDTNATVIVERFNEELAEYEEVEVQLKGGWLPWRRCYCSRGSRMVGSLEPGLSTVGKCAVYRQEKERCGYVCSRTGFFDQNCSNDDCEGC